MNSTQADAYKAHKYRNRRNVDRIKYGYDLSGNRIWRENVVSRADDFMFDEKYVYDQINRLNRMDRGELKPNRTLIHKQFSQEWSLDATGNWRKFLEDSTDSVIGIWSNCVIATR
jgi:hypothetical protein